MAKLSQKQLTAVIVCSVLAGGAIIGGTTGGILARVLKPEKQNFDDILDQVDNSTTNVEEAKSIMDRYQKCMDENKDPTEEFAIHELIFISEQRFLALDNTMTLGFGYASAAGNVSVLDVRNACIKNGERYFEESISKSASGIDVKVAERAYQENDEIKVHEATFAKGANAEHPTWKDEYSTWNKTDYRTNYGKTVDTLGIYIVNEKTIIQGENTYITKDDTGYTLTMEMDTIYTVPRYVRRMHALSNSDVSKFYYVNLEYRLDLELNLVYSYVHEQYAARLGEISAKTTGRMITYYYTDDDYMIPDIDTSINYDLKGEKLPEE